MSTFAMVLIAIFVVIVLYVVIANAIARAKGYSIPGKTAVRCARGHVFETTWIEGGSIFSVRLGFVKRYQRCPVGRHWSVVEPIKPADLTDGDRLLLAEARAASN